MSPISHGADWDFDLLERYDAEIAKVAKEFELDTYPNQVEIITSEQMLDAYASSGLPIGYPHWSYGKEFIRNEQAYRRGMQGLAYEIVINSSPCIAYLMEENTMAMQALVIAHAAYGHNSFFKGNYLFRMWTDASSIIDYLVYALVDLVVDRKFPVIEKVSARLEALESEALDRPTSAKRSFMTSRPSHQVWFFASASTVSNEKPSALPMSRIALFGR